METFKKWLCRKSNSLPLLFKVTSYNKYLNTDKRLSSVYFFAIIAITLWAKPCTWTCTSICDLVADSLCVWCECLWLLEPYKSMYRFTIQCTLVQPWVVSLGVGQFSYWRKSKALACAPSEHEWAGTLPICALLNLEVALQDLKHDYIHVPPCPNLSMCVCAWEWHGVATTGRYLITVKWILY